MGQGTSFRRTSYADHLAKLESACKWLSVDRGRAAQYGDLVRDFHQKDARSREHILAYAESCEIVDLYQLWEQRITSFPGLKEKIGAVFAKGPLLREDEKSASSSNRPRNDAFVYLVAGMLLKAGIPVEAVDGILALHSTCDTKADLTFASSGRFIDIECKRPQTYEALVVRAKKARKQIAQPSRGRHGVIALDCSILVRRAGTLLESESLEAAESLISRELETSVTPRVVRCLTNSVLGFLFFARVPAMTRLGIVTPMCEPILRRDCISTWLVVSNREYEDRGILACLAEQLYGAILTF